MVAAHAAAEILDALRGYLWILLAAVVVWRLFPVIRKRVESEDFQLEIAGQRVSFQSASKQLHDALDDLQSQVIALAERVDGTTAEVAEHDASAAAESASTRPTRILWADDRPENNAFLIKSLQDRGAQVVEETSTDAALARLEADALGFDVVVSDMGRKEEGADRPFAGVDLVRRMRDAGIGIPVVIYASPGAIARGGTAAREAGAVLATASPTELLRTLRVAPTSAFEASVGDILRRNLHATPFPIYRSVDYVAESDGERLGIEIKNWSSTPTPAELERALARLATARERDGFERILLITQRDVELPPGVDVPGWLDVLTVDELVEWLAARSS